MSGVYVGIDGSSHSQVALAWAMREAGYRHQPLTVIAVHEVPISAWGGSMILSGDEGLRDKTRQAAPRRPWTRPRLNSVTRPLQR